MSLQARTRPSFQTELDLDTAAESLALAFSIHNKRKRLGTTGRMYDEFIRLLFLHSHRETSVLANELPQESDKYRFLHVSCFANLKGTVGFIMTKASAMRISIPLDLSSGPLVPLPRFIR